jgi:hypothetical protein
LLKIVANKDLKSLCTFCARNLSKVKIKKCAIGIIVKN